MKLEYIVKNNDKYKTIKDVLLSHFHISHHLLVNLKKKNSILLNGNKTYMDYSIKEKDIVTISFIYDEDNSNIVSTNLPLDIIYEDDWYLVINKPAGIPVHPSIQHYKDSLSNGVKFYYDKIGLKKKIRPVIRLDKDTSGLVVFAKNEYTQEELSKQMKSGKFYKEYIAIVEGRFTEKSGTINAPIARKEGSIIERCIKQNGAPSITHYKVLEEKIYNNQYISKVQCTLETGRTHQIRVHLSNIGHPLLGDDLYNGSKDLISRQALHCYKISFKHPITNQKQTYIAEIPEDISKIALEF